MRHYFTDLVCAWMDGSPLLLPARSVSGINWSPGVRLSAQTSFIKKDDRKDDQELEITLWQEYAKTKWQIQWYGIPYPRAKLMWADIMSPAKASTFKDSYWKPEPRNDLYATHYLETFYAKLRTIQRNPAWTGYDMSSACVHLPSISQRPPNGYITIRVPNAAMGTSFDDWVAHCANPLHHLSRDKPFKNPDVESEDEVGGDFVEEVWYDTHDSSPTSVKDDSEDGAEGPDKGDVVGESTDEGEYVRSEADGDDIVMNDADGEPKTVKRSAPRQRMRGKVMEMPPPELGMRNVLVLS